MGHQARSVEEYVQSLGWQRRMGSKGDTTIPRARSPDNFIDQNGKILEAGHPAGLQFKRIIDAALH